MSATTKPIHFKRPLVSVWTVVSLTDLKTEDQVLVAIEDGRLLYAFNIAGKESNRRLIRVLAGSVSNFIGGSKPPKMSDAEEWAEVVRTIFPTSAPSIPAKEIAVAWNISGTHILNLCDQKLLRLSKGTPRRSGPAGSPQVELASAVEFLRARRVF